ncbi:hypothetical protein [Pseudomonas sp. TCU-HL1]|uniref:hypothetical protein n=1 Tax=Pseudomonas sp. TCU-HL1 TaxID=1856685 RepID=UPI000858EE1F|nr:hypothetical protein [Pseudomonas sp. TCU-HL1]AOE87950.1 hypothetical protein THL1_5403 [Pseudomonas sp. TCU-HL1]
MNKATRPGEQGGPLQAEPSHAPSKIARVLAHLLYSSSLNRFEAERIGDHCLHSTISSLTHSYGLRLMRIPEKVPNHWGAPCGVTRYSLPSSEHCRAQNVLLLLNQRNTARPLRSELRA